MTTFALVHGVCAGAWYWDLLTPHLEEAGHEVIAMDLPSEDAGATFSDYADVVYEALGATNDDVVLVGHSTGGSTIPLVAARRAVRQVVFLCGNIPVPGKSVLDLGFDFRASDPAEWMVVHDDGSFSVRPEVAGRYFAQDLDSAVAAEAAARLRRQSMTPFSEPCPLEALPDVPYRYILCREDRLVSPDWSRRAAPARLGVEPIEIDGSHVPMLSRPADLASVLLSPDG